MRKIPPTYLGTSTEINLVPYHNGARYYATDDKYWYIATGKGKWTPLDEWSDKKLSRKWWQFWK